MLFELQAQEFKVIGYLPYYRFHLIDDVQYEKLTHINLAFANPDMSGNLDLGGRDIEPVVTRAHNEGIEVFLSLAGGALTDEWEAAWLELIKPANRSSFIHKIVGYALNHQLDGIDLDLEWSHVNHNYSGFALELKDSLDQYSLPFTAALPGTYRYPQISDEVLAAYDWINMMAYDLRGPWDPDNPGPHSPMSFALNAIEYWEGKGVEKERLTLGVPFYGYDFSNPDQVRALTYAQIVNLDPANAHVDQTGDIYYNGIPTIAAKTQLAIDELSGIMMWELGQDKYDEFSLLSKIDEVVRDNFSSVTELRDVDKIIIYPNPVINELNIKSSIQLTGDLIISTIQGNKVFHQQIENENSLNIDVRQIQAGLYFIYIKGNDQIEPIRFIKL